ncbi:MAG: NAD(P)/FAD-dependent oxidoreductase [Flavobacteriaceae bacterium]
MSQKTLIVGFGIAGASLAHRLDEQDRDFKIISDHSQQATRVAGGVINPIALKRYKKAWNADLFFPKALAFYKALEIKLSDHFLDLRPTYKALKSAEDQNDFMAATDRSFLKDFLSSKILYNDKIFSDADAIGVVNSTYTIDLNTFLDQSIRYFDMRFLSDSFHYADLKCLEDHSFNYAGEIFDQVVFCEGYGVIHNPYFTDLPVYGNKGEYLILASDDLQLQNRILKSKYFLIPLGDNLYKFGANYDRNSLNNQPTQDAREHLLEQFEKMISCSYEVIDQVAGIRPTLKDRKPILGAHPSYQQMFIFNGFGSRGVLGAPHLSQILSGFIFGKKTLDSDIDVKRFY